MRNPIEDFRYYHEFYLWSGEFEVCDLAKFVGVSPRTIHRWLIGENQPCQARIRQIKTFLNKQLGLFPIDTLNFAQK